MKKRSADQAREAVYRQVRRALKTGRLVRARNCESCGIPDRKIVDGRPAIQAHHPDYSKPLDVVWLCTLCHRAVTPLPERIGASAFGKANGLSKLTEDLVREIRASTESSRKIAARLGVEKRTILNVRNGITWRQVQ